jgi:lipoprotein-releasing system permease protein
MAAQRNSRQGFQFKWIGFVAFRYMRGRRRNSTSPAPVLAILGIAVGVLALTVIIAVMNGFQLGFIESILEISSYHLRIDSFPPGPEGAALIEKIETLSSVVSAVPFHEIQGITQGRRSSQTGAVVRGLPPDALKRDRGMAEKLVFEGGSFDLRGEDSILLGAELARRLGLKLQDQFTLVSVSGDILSAIGREGENSRFIVTGIFRTGFYEYDLSWGFINLQRASLLAGETERPVLGIKLKSRWQVENALQQVRSLLASEGMGGLEVHSWREYNRAFFGALRTEKLFMFILVGLIFIIVGLNIFQAQRRSVLERREEIGLFRAVGATDLAVRLVFVWDGCIIGFTGASIGMALGLLISNNIGAFFTLLEGVVNGIIRVLNLVTAGLFGANTAEEGFAVFSSTIFYIKEIPSRVIPHEVLFIFMFGFLSALLAAWFASGRISRIKPAEVLRYE